METKRNYFVNPAEIFKPSLFDPLGMYGATPIFISFDNPTQDADDL